jgi:RNA polymerase sigma-70 factor (ECF subfamily)
MLAEEKALLVTGLEAEFEAGDLSRPAAETLRSTSDLALVARLRAGESAAFEELVGEYQPLVHSLSLRILGDAEDARDASQETFIKVYRHLARFRGDASLKTWICRIAINQARSHKRWFRRRRRDGTHSLDADDEQFVSLSHLKSSGASPEAVTLAQERHRQIERALTELKSDFRIAVILRDIEGMTYEEMAVVLEISIGTVKSRIARGREMIRSKLEKAGSVVLNECEKHDSEY